MDQAQKDPTYVSEPDDEAESLHISETKDDITVYEEEEGCTEEEEYYEEEEKMTTHHIVIENKAMSL